MGSITKQGSTLARFLLGQLVLHVLRDDVWMRTWFRAITPPGFEDRPSGRDARLATIIWHLLTKNEAYVCGGPPRSRLQRQPVTTES